MFNPLIPVSRIVPALTAGLGLSLSAAEIPAPKVTDSRLELRVFAAEPDIVTPIGLASDARGRLYAVESHTHFPPRNYAGPKHDRVRLLEDADRDGRPEKISTFADGLHHAMHVNFGPDGRLYLAHRNGVLRLDDADGDGVSEARVTVLELDTPGNYPHNGLGGVTFSPDGWLYVGLGENLGERYTLKGTDGRTHSGGGEGGNVFRCRPDGSQLELVATGFWNPFGLEFYAGEFLLCLDNDPDSRPPNRLLDVVRHGDYGYKFRYGRNGLHPFTAWNGELPGTLPMMAGTGEGASGLLVCDRARLPAEYRGAVLVTSWGDHRIELYRPRTVGASLSASREVVAEGGEWFRPVALTTTPDGAIYFTDWVDKSYSVHGKGRVWKLAARDGVKTEPPRTNAVAKLNSQRRRLARLLDDKAELALDDLFKGLQDRDPFIRSAAVAGLSHPDLRDVVTMELRSPNPQIRLGALLALRRSRVSDPAPFLEKLLADASEPVRLMALVWAGEEKVHAVSNHLGTALTSGPVSPALLRVHAAAVQILLPRKTNASTADVTAGAAGRARVFSLVAARDEVELIEQVRKPANSGAPEARLEAVRRLAGANSPEAFAALAAVAQQTKLPETLRAEAIVGLAHDAATNFNVLRPLLRDSSAVVRREAARALRAAAADPRAQKLAHEQLATAGAKDKDAELFAQLSLLDQAGKGEVRPGSEADWHKKLDGPGDAEAGRRVFYHPVVACGRCHRVEDHGGQIGPDLSTIARSSNREKLIQSMLLPSREIAPQFATHQVETRDSESYSGLLIGSTADGSLTLALSDGKAVLVPGTQVASHEPSKVSLMPEGLDQALTVQDFRDLLAYLLARK